MAGDEMMDEPFARAYPHLARWVTTQGWIEVGDDGMQPSRVRVLRRRRPHLGRRQRAHPDRRRVARSRDGGGTLSGINGAHLQRSLA